MTAITDVVLASLWSAYASVITAPWPVLTVTAFALYIGWCYIRFWQVTAQVGGMPGHRQLLSPMHPLVALDLLPNSIFGVPLFPMRRSFGWTTKYDGLYAKYGADVVSFTSMSNATVMVADAMLTKKITGNRTRFPKPLEYYGVLELFGSNVVTVEGDLWRLHRKVAAPSFSDNNNRLVNEQAVKHTLEMFRGWHKGVADPKAPVIARVDKDMIKLALYIISGAGFGKKPPKNHRMTFLDSLEVVAYNTLPRLLIPRMAFKALSFIPYLNTGFEEFDLYLQEIVKSARHRLADSNVGSPAEEGNFRQADLIHALVEAASMADTSDSGVGEPAAPALTDRELYGNIFIFLFAGHETTAHTLIYALTLLALHPKEQDKLFDEVIAAIGTTSTPAYEDFGELAYALCVFNETLRLFPPVVAIPKKFTEDTMIDEKYTVEKDVYITLHVAALHRNPKYWGDDANEFRPSRFDTRKNADAYNRDAFIPFSDGMRSCLGKRFAQVEAVCILALIAQRYRIELADEKDRSTILESREVLTLTPVNPVRLKFTPRG